MNMTEKQLKVLEKLSTELIDFEEVLYNLGVEFPSSLEQAWKNHTILIEEERAKLIGE